QTLQQTGHARHGSSGFGAPSRVSLLLRFDGSAAQEQQVLTARHSRSGAGQAPPFGRSRIRKEHGVYTSSALFLVASLVGQPPGPPQSFREFAKTATFYYTAPDPAFGPRMLKELLKRENLEHPFFANNDHLLNINAALLGDIAAGKPKIVRAYEAAFLEAP